MSAEATWAGERPADLQKGKALSGRGWGRSLGFPAGSTRRPAASPRPPVLSGEQMSPAVRGTRCGSRGHERPLNPILME